MNSDFCYTPDQKALTFHTLAPAISLMKDPSRSRAFAALRSYAAFVISDTHLETCRGRIRLPLGLLWEANNLIGDAISMVGPEFETKTGDPGRLLIYGDLSCLIAVEDKIKSEEMGRTWVCILPMIFQIPKTITTRFLTETLHLSGPSESRDREMALCIKTKSNKHVPLLDEDACSREGINLLHIESIRKSLLEGCQEWAEALEHMPILHIPKVGEPRTGILGQDSATKLTEFAGCRYAWPASFEWVNYDASKTAKLSSFLRRALIYVLHKNKEHLTAISVTVTAGRNLGTKTSRPKIEIKSNTKGIHKDDKKHYEQDLKNELFRLLTTSDVPINFTEALGTELPSVQGRLISAPAILASETIFKEELSAHERMAALSHYRT